MPLDIPKMLESAQIDKAYVMPQSTIRYGQTYRIVAPLRGACGTVLIAETRRPEVAELIARLLKEAAKQ